MIGGCELYLGDSSNILPTLDKMDLCVSDVPYPLTSGGVSKSSKTMSGIFDANNYSNDGQLIAATVPFDEMMDLIYSSLKNDADFYVMANDKNVRKLGNAAVQSGFKEHNILVWDKVSPTANRWYMKNLEFTLYLYKGKAKTINDPSSKQTCRAGERNESKHPTEKPVSLMSEYIRNSSQPNDIVLDPYMGSGTTMVAAIQQGRKGVGIEIDPTYFDMACKRCEDAVKSPLLFSESQTAPQNLDMFKGDA